MNSYDKLQLDYIDNNIFDVTFIFNCDESGFQTDTTNLRTVGLKGLKLYLALADTPSLPLKTLPGL